MESLSEVSLLDRVAAEFDSAQIVYDRAGADLFLLRCGHDAVRFVVAMRLIEDKGIVWTPDLFHAQSEEEFKAIAYLNFRVLTIGRLGVNPKDGEVQFEAEFKAGEPGDFVESFQGAAFFGGLAAEALSRVRLGGVSAQVAIEATMAARARATALASIEDAANEAWESADGE